MYYNVDNFYSFANAYGYRITSTDKASVDQGLFPHQITLDAGTIYLVYELDRNIMQDLIQQIDYAVQFHVTSCPAPNAVKIQLMDQVINRQVDFMSLRSNIENVVSRMGYSALSATAPFSAPTPFVPTPMPAYSALSQTGTKTPKVQKSKSVGLGILGAFLGAFVGLAGAVTITHFSTPFGASSALLIPLVSLVFYLIFSGPKKTVGTVSIALFSTISAALFGPILGYVDICIRDKKLYMLDLAWVKIFYRNAFDGSNKLFTDYRYALIIALAAILLGIVITALVCRTKAKSETISHDFNATHSYVPTTADPQPQHQQFSGQSNNNTYYQPDGDVRQAAPQAPQTNPFAQPAPQFHTESTDYTQPVSQNADRVESQDTTADNDGFETLGTTHDFFGKPAETDSATNEQNSQPYTENQPSAPTFPTERGDES